jgi:integrase
MDLRDSLTNAFKVTVRTRRQAHWLSAPEVVAIVDACPPGVSGDRDRLMIRFLALTGLRREEAMRCQWKHVDLTGRTLWVPKGKGDKERYVGLLDRAVELLGEWRQRCATDLGAVPTSHPVLPTIGFGAGGGRDPYLWWDRPSKVWYGQRYKVDGPFWPMGYQSIGRQVLEAGRRAGIDDLQCHDLRRSFAGLLEDAGVPVQQISAQLGHAGLDTTMRYLSSNPRKRADALVGIAVNV